MEVLLRLLQELRVALVAVAALVAAAFLFTALGAWLDLRRARFRLERNLLRQRMLSSLMRALIFLVVGGMVWSVPEQLGMDKLPRSGLPATLSPRLVVPVEQPTAALPTPMPTADLSGVLTVEPTLPPTPTPDQVLAALLGTSTPTAEPVAPALLAVPGLPATPTPTLAPSPEPTLPALDQAVPTLAPLPEPSPTAAPVPTETPLVANCPNPDAQITSPAAGQIVRGRLPILGTAGFPPGSKYKIEILRPGIEEWAFLWEGFSEVKGGVLMPDFNADLFAPGMHVLRLIIIDPAGQETSAVCRVPIRIGE